MTMHNQGTIPGAAPRIHMDGAVEWQTERPIYIVTWQFTIYMYTYTCIYSTSPKGIQYKYMYILGILHHVLVNTLKSDEMP